MVIVYHWSRRLISLYLSYRSQLIANRPFLLHDFKLKVTWLSENVRNNFFKYHEHQNPILDTKITFLSRLIPEITDHMCFGVHIGRHLEFLNSSVLPTSLPSKIVFSSLFWRKWGTTHIIITKLHTGIQLATHYLQVKRIPLNTCKNARHDL